MSTLLKEIAAGKYQLIFISPEMALHNEKFQAVMSKKEFRRKLLAINVDEAHTISIWGGDFRKDFKSVGKIRARAPSGIPVAAVSATFRPNVKMDVLGTLGFAEDDYLDLNIGNERTNVFVGVRGMKHSAESLWDLSGLFSSEATEPSDIPKTMIYIDDVIALTKAVAHINCWLHPSLRRLGLIKPVNAWMPPSYRSQAMEEFKAGTVRIIICTEAAGMVRSSL